MIFRFLFRFWSPAIFFLFLGQTFAQDIQSLHFKGFLNGKTPLSLQLSIHGDKIHGILLYDKHGIPIKVDGESTENNYWSLTEYAGGTEPTGMLIGQYMAGQGMTGKWKSPNGEKEFNLELKEATAQSIALDYFSIEKEVKMFEDKPDSLNAVATYFESLWWPKMSRNKEYMKCAFRLLLASKKEMKGWGPQKFMELNWEDYREEYLVNAQDIDVQEMEYFHMFNWDKSSQMEIMWNAGRLFTYQDNVYEYSGGAHGNYGSFAQSYDLEKCKLISLADIFLPEYEKFLPPILEAQFRKDMNLEPDQELNEYLFENHIPPTENFLLYPGALTFIYTPYEIGPYAVGQIEITLAFKELSGYLSPDFFLRPEGK